MGMNGCGTCVRKGRVELSGIVPNWNGDGKREVFLVISLWIISIFKANRECTRGYLRTRKKIHVNR